MPRTSKRHSPKKKVAGVGSNSLLTAKEACELLGIKPQTLYAYVSRGQLRAERRPGKQGHFYSLDELEALRARSRARSGHGATAASAMRWGEPILDSAITYIQGDMIYYRGHALSELMRSGLGFENVAELLWSGELPSQPLAWQVEAVRGVFADARSGFFSDEGSSLARRLLHRLSELALSDRQGREELLDDSLRRARCLIMAAADELFDLSGDGSAKISGHHQIAEQIAVKLFPKNTAVATEAINAALIASADHELNASTFAARIAASTGADLYACVLAGIAAFSGRQHGLFAFEVYDFVSKVARPLDGATYLASYMVTNQTVPGFGHRLYPDGDPRAKLLLEYAKALAKHTPLATRQRMDTMFALVEAAKAQGLQPPNIDFALVALAIALGLTATGASSFFVISRMVGWTAHVLEQRQQGFLLRPRARYIGRVPLVRK